MATKTFVKAPPPHTKTLIIKNSFYEALTEIMDYGIETFGASVVLRFYNQIFDRIMHLTVFYDANPKNRFIESTKTKVYRNILIEKYAVLYSVTRTSIHVITIYHTAINPETIKDFAV